MDKNEIKKILNESIYESVNKIVEERIKKLSFNYCVEGQIQQANKDPRDTTKIISYNIIINGSVQTVYNMNNAVYQINDVVYVLVINNNYSQKYVLCKKPANII